MTPLLVLAEFRCSEGGNAELRKHLDRTLREARAVEGCLQATVWERAAERRLICRRVGRSKANLGLALARSEKVRRDAYVWTARRPARAPAIDARATARRRLAIRRPHLGHGLGARGLAHPVSRKSTRKSVNRTRGARLAVFTRAAGCSRWDVSSPLFDAQRAWA
jgi:hypothetical protein